VDPRTLPDHTLTEFNAGLTFIKPTFDNTIILIQIQTLIQQFGFQIFGMVWTILLVWRSHAHLHI